MYGHLIHKTFRELAPLLPSGGTGGLIELQTQPVVLNLKKKVPELFSAANCHYQPYRLCTNTL